MTDDAKAVIAARAAQELRPGEIVNLGIGIPNLIPGLLGEGANVFLHTENGLLGVGPRPGEDELDPDLIDAAKRPVTALPGAAYFDSAQSFAMIRGGHIDVAVLGGLEVSEEGDLANWYLPERGGGSIGGAMDLAVGAKRLIVAMSHATRDGRPRIRRRCEYPLTARAVVDLIVTDLAVIEVRPDGLLLTEVAPGVDPAFVEARTEPALRRSPNLREMEL